MHEQRVKNAIAEADCAISTVSIAETMRQRNAANPLREIRAVA
jgi:hypothetical protein